MYYTNTAHTMTTPTPTREKSNKEKKTYIICINKIVYFFFRCFFIFFSLLLDVVPLNGNEMRFIFWSDFASVCALEWVDCRASKTFDNTLVVGFVFYIISTFISIVLFCFICDISFGMAYVRGIRYSTWLVGWLVDYCVSLYVSSVSVMFIRFIHAEGKIDT